MWHDRHVTDGTANNWRDGARPEPFVATAVVRDAFVGAEPIDAARFRRDIDAAVDQAPEPRPTPDRRDPPRR
jgi:hypothetical protein